MPARRVIGEGYDPAAAEGGDMVNGQPLRCSFCGKSEYEVLQLIAGAEVYICDKCTDLAYAIVHRPENEQGFQAATYLGSRVYRYGYLEPRKDIVRKLVPHEYVRTK